MTIHEIQDFVHVYSMFSFKDGRKEPGICVNKYNIMAGEIEYYFVPQLNMHAYKTAFERYDKQMCKSLCYPLKPEELLSIRPVSLSDYKLTMQLLEERNQLLNYRP